MEAAAEVSGRVLVPGVWAEAVLACLLALAVLSLREVYLLELREHLMWEVQAVSVVTARRTEETAAVLVSQETAVLVARRLSPALPRALRLTESAL